MIFTQNCSVDTAVLRAAVNRKVRQFFHQRDILEVEVPLLYSHSNPAPYLNSVAVGHQYLQTSPELLLKQLLANGFPDCYSLGKAFRQAEVSRKHNPEFTLLEWYRLGMDEHQLMQDVDDLIRLLMPINSTHHLRYKDLFIRYLGINPLELDDGLKTDELTTIVSQQTSITATDANSLSINDRLGWLMSDIIEPKLAMEYPNCLVFVHDYPSHQAEMARTGHDTEGYSISHRFEVFINGYELANGYHELNDTQQQKLRMQREIQYRIDNDLPAIGMDETFLNSLDALPDCSGVALGVDRLLQVISGYDDIHQLLTFSSTKPQGLS